MVMDGIFKQKLLSMRNPTGPRTFAEALFQEASWIKKSVRPEKAVLPPKEVYTEKTQVIESLERFALEKTQESQTPVIKLDGGEVHVRPEPSWEGVSIFSSQEDLINGLSLESDLKNLVLMNKEMGKVKVIFVTEKFRPWNEVSPELKSGFIDQLIAGFPLKTAELFERMVVAMKLIPEEVIVYPVEGHDESDYAGEVMSIATFYGPEVIVTLGAKATSRILKSNDRLSLVHGQFFTRKSGNASFQIVPLFHPSIIETNQNMKKTAWADMQKIMKHLKKLP